MVFGDNSLFGLRVDAARRIVAELLGKIVGTSLNGYLKTLPFALSANRRCERLHTLRRVRSSATLRDIRANEMFKNFQRVRRMKELAAALSLQQEHCVIRSVLNHTS